MSKLCSHLTKFVVQKAHIVGSYAAPARNQLITVNVCKNRHAREVEGRQ